MQDTTFGGIPVVLIAGDDYQLSGITEGAHECTISHLHTKKHTKKPLVQGRQLFCELAHTVFELPKARRIKEGNSKHREIMDRIKTGEGVTNEDVNKLQSLHLDAIKSKHGSKCVQEIRSQSIHLFFSNEKRINHNLHMLSQLNTDKTQQQYYHRRAFQQQRAKAIAVTSEQRYANHQYYVAMHQLLFAIETFFLYLAFTTQHVG